MATSPPAKVIRRLSKVALAEVAGMTDGQLLERFVARRDEAAFASLVRKHGPMVFGVCRRVLCNHHDAEDAFQATFLVLVRKATTVVPREMVGNWLYGVACQTALRARAAGARRRAREPSIDPVPEPAATSRDPWHDLRPVLDQELSRLPDKYRVPIVLCDLESMSYDEAARRLGWPIGTLAGRLSRARKLLAGRLARHGLAVGGSLATMLSLHGASAGMPAALAAATVKAACAMAAGRATAEFLSANVAALTEGVLKAMFHAKLKMAGCVLLMVSILGAGVGASALFAEPQQDDETAQRQSAPANGAAAPQQPAAAPEKGGKRVSSVDIAVLDETKVVRIAAATDGRIERMYKATGARVKKGDVLAELHSPELMTTTTALLLANNGGDQNQENAARELLRHWQLDDQQIAAILKAGKPVSSFTLRAPLDGYVIRTYGIRGAHVKAGDPLYDLAELSAVTFKEKQATPAAPTNERIKALLEERRATLKELVKLKTTEYHAGRTTFSEVAKASSHLLKAELELCTTAQERRAKHEEAVVLAEFLEKSVVERYKAGAVTQASVLEATASRLEAQIALERAKAAVEK